MPQESIEKLIKNRQNPKLIEDAFNFAQEAYKGKNRISGENYIHHAFRVASHLNKIGLDDTTITFALLHDIADIPPRSDKKIEILEIEKKFGKEVAQLVKKISDLSKTKYRQKKDLTKDSIENLRRMFLAIAGDLRVVLVELVSRLDGLNFMQDFKKDEQVSYATETLQIFVPIASRLGLNEIRRSLEDISFVYAFPEKFEWLKNNLQEKYEKREKFLRNFTPKLKKFLLKEHLDFADINFRAKSYWSTYQKLEKYEMDVSRVHDLIALRVIVKNIPNCYKALGIIHKYFKPISSEEINDYIAKPKINGYRSLHTTVFADKDKIVEIQIRTEEMQKEAEYGVCAHWSYKEKIDLKKSGADFEWMQDAPDFWKAFKINFFPNHVFVFTPKGDIISLPKGATPVDFAYAVHSDIGSHCESAKIAGKIVQLNHALENGDVVEITTNKNKKPSKDWLRFVKTGFARSHIKKLTEEESKFKLPFAGFIKKKFAEISEAAKKKISQKEQVKKEQIRHIYLAGQKGMLVNVAKCCSPQPGDKVKAYLTKYRSAVLHKASCQNFRKLAAKFPEKIIDADWK